MCGSNRSLEPFEVDGVEWIDGSVQADLPFQRISTLFAVSSFIVSQVRMLCDTGCSRSALKSSLTPIASFMVQTNFHIIPLLNKAHHPNRKSLYWQIFQTIEWDIRSRALKLSRLGYVCHCNDFSWIESESSSAHFALWL
jgi:predicted acylesterase/phospholipase RssA